MPVRVIPIGRPASFLSSFHTAFLSSSPPSFSLFLSSFSFFLPARPLHFLVSSFISLPGTLQAGSHGQAHTPLRGGGVPEAEAAVLEAGPGSPVPPGRTPHRPETLPTGRGGTRGRWGATRGPGWRRGKGGSLEGEGLQAVGHPEGVFGVGFDAPLIGIRL